jgi:hypothetical protein
MTPAVRVVHYSGVVRWLEAPMLPCITAEDQEGGSSPLMLRPSSTSPAARVEHYSSAMRCWEAPVLPCVMAEDREGYQAC